MPHQKFSALWMTMPENDKIRFDGMSLPPPHTPPPKLA